MLANDEASAQQFAVVQDQLAWLDKQMGEAGGPYICGAAYTICDIQLYAFIEFFLEFFPAMLDAPLPAVKAWRAAVAARPATISCYPASSKL